MSETQIAAADPHCKDNALRQQLCLALPQQSFSPIQLADLTRTNVFTLKIDDSSPNFKRRHLGMLYLRGQRPKHVSIDVDNQTSSDLVTTAQLNASLALSEIKISYSNENKISITFGGFKLIEQPEAAEYHLLLLFPFTGNMPSEFTDPSSRHLIDGSSNEYRSQLGQAFQTNIIKCFRNDLIHADLEHLSTCLTIMLNNHELHCCSNQPNSINDKHNHSTHKQWRNVLHLLTSQHSFYENQRTSPNSGHSCLFKDACPYTIFPQCMHYGNTSYNETRYWIENWAKGINGIISNHSQNDSD